MSVEGQDERPEGENEEAWDEDEEYDEDDEELDAEAEEIARKLWADISRNQPPSETLTDITLPHAEVDHHPTQEEVSALRTIEKVLSLLSLDSEASDILQSWVVSSSSSPSSNVLDEMRSIASSGKLDQSQAQSLGTAILRLVKSDVLVSRSSFAEKQLGVAASGDKRKREMEDEGDSTKRRRLSAEAQDLVNKMMHATQSIQSALEKSSIEGSPSLDIASLAEPFERVYAFAVSASRTVANPVGYDPSSLQLQLQEISGLVQVLGVLGGTPFTENPSSGTIVFPCSSPSCGRTFQDNTTFTDHVQSDHGSGNLGSSSLQTGDKTHQCTHCRQSFLRLHDLKRHLLTHAVFKHAFQCGGCARIFSRRDAAKRHMDGAKDKLRAGELKPDSEKAKCAAGQILDVQQDLSGSMMDKFPLGGDDDGTSDEEPGELPRETLSGLYAAVLGLAGGLRSCVSNSPASSASAAASAQVQGSLSLDEAIKNVLSLASQQKATSNG